MNAYTVSPLNRTAGLFASFPEEIQPGVTVNFLGDVSVENMDRVRAACGRAGHPRPSYTSFVLKAAAITLRAHSFANQRLFRLPFLGRRMQAFQDVDAAVLCERDLPQAPMAAFAEVIRNTADLPLLGIHGHLKTLVECGVETNKQWRELNTLIRRCPAWLARWLCRLPVHVPRWWVKYRGGALVVSSPAKYGVDAIQAAWPWPLAFSFGLAQDRAVVQAGLLTVKKVFTLSMNFDRRIMAGAQAARFFKHVRDGLTNADQSMLPHLPMDVQRALNDPGASSVTERSEQPNANRQPVPG